MNPSILSGENAEFIDEQYRRWVSDPSSVSAEWGAIFESSQDAPPNGARFDFPGPSRRSIFHGGASAAASGPADPRVALRQAAVVQLINAFRVRGHFKAQLDPLGSKEALKHPELTPDHYGLTEADLDAVVATAPLTGVPAMASVRDVLAHLRASYSDAIGAEFMNIDDTTQKRWVIERLEALPNTRVLEHKEELHILRKLSDAESFEQLIHRRFPGTKRFSLEGGETLIPLLDMLIAESGRAGVAEIVMGMAHRGRLNVLANILEKPTRMIIDEFEDSRGPTQGSGDVKYHLGYSSDVTTVHGDVVHLSLTPNPSHLEAVDPVVQGRTRAKQDRVSNDARDLAMPVLIHGDAAFIGQGLVAETFQLSELRGYRTGGTVHVVVNNQIGFTTAPRDARSTPYCTDIARMMGIPIFHVNGEDPRAVAAVVRIAVAWRQAFHRDVVIDMYCYRKHGHNEGDEPSFTQPLMYDRIRKRATPRQNYADKLLTVGPITKDDVDRIFAEARDAMDALANDEAAAERARRIEGTADSAARDRWQPYLSGDWLDPVDSAVPFERLRDLLLKANSFPDGFNPHRKVVRLVDQRREMARGERPLDWATAEQAAFASLLTEGYAVRLSGQDSCRGTFSQRHAVWTDTKSSQEFYSLDALSDDQRRFSCIDSNLSEAGVLGFEYGFSLDTPDALVLWEAQFGDFANGAQVIYDQFIASAEQKWGRLSGLVMLLPHGFEGQGPEHSSARLERYLLQCAQGNTQVANCTTPANYFHLLRRQALMRTRKPLVVMTPKSLLRHARATSTLEDLANGGFQPVIPDSRSLDAAGLKRVIFCSGKLYYELIEAVEALDEATTIAVHRVEMLHPFPASEIKALIEQAPSSAKVVWCQEEPRNMGAWPVVSHWLADHLPSGVQVRYAGRVPAASPATGSHNLHKREQAQLIEDALHN